MSSKVFYSRFPAVRIPLDVSVPQLILSRAKQFGDKVALIDGVDGIRLTYSDIERLVRILSSSLSERGVKKGDTILLCTANCIEYPIIMLAVSSLGAILTTANPFNTAKELYIQMEDSGASFVISSQKAAEHVREASDEFARIKGRFVLGASDGFQPFADLIRDSGSYPPDVQIKPKEDTMLLPYSSGTTGKPKGVMLTHYNLVANIYQLANPGTALAVYPGRETYICYLPFYHVFGLTMIQLYGLFEGNTLVVLPNFELKSYLKAVQTFKATILHIVPPTAVLLSKHPMVDEFDLSSVQLIYCGAAQLGKVLEKELKERMNIRNFRQGYGLSETGPALTISPAEGMRLGSSGMLLPNTMCRIVDIETGLDLGVGQNGELWFKGPQIMKGYHRRPDATDEMIDKDGWLRTGDIGHVDEDGHYFIVDRLKELIKYKGLQVAPAELEDILLGHPAIADTAVIGIPEPEAGELPRAFCVKKPGATVTDGDLIKFVGERVAPHKRLRGGVEFIAKVPKSASGKILRRVLKEKAGASPKANL